MYIVLDFWEFTSKHSIQLQVDTGFSISAIRGKRQTESNTNHPGARWKDGEAWNRIIPETKSIEWLLAIELNGGHRGQTDLGAEKNKHHFNMDMT